MKVYNRPEIEVLTFASEDVITASGFADTFTWAINTARLSMDDEL